MLPIMMSQEPIPQFVPLPDPSEPEWVRQNSATGKATSSWHLLLSVKMGTNRPYALTFDGQVYTSPRGTFTQPSSNVCANCANVYRRVTRDASMTWLEAGFPVAV